MSSKLLLHNVQAARILKPLTHLSGSMKTFLARLLLAFMLVWLPLQGYAAGAMPFCSHQHGATQSLTDVHEGCHSQHASAHQDTRVQHGGACDDCFSCHLIAQPALIAESLALGVENNRMFRPPSTIAFTLIFPEQPQHPPLAVFS